MNDHNTSWTCQAEKIVFETRHFIGGDYCQPSGHDVFQTVNPATHAELAKFPDGGN